MDTQYRYFVATDEYTADQGPIVFRTQDGVEGVFVRQDDRTFLDRPLFSSIEMAQWLYTDDEDDRVSFAEVSESEVPA